ncbi:MAG: RNA 2',3'-cyclic phosphodiesterase [Clostridia bacterium]|nr:RNA 2',3'-cyclic phosphodiesterase [Clostridia bacterium]
MKRIFFAIPFEDDVKAVLSTAQKSVMHQAKSGKFHDKENFHLTIKFLGMVDDDLVEPLWLAVVEAVKDMSGFTITLDRIGSFQKKSKCIPWVGIEPSEALNVLHERIRCAVESILQTVEEQAYTPHITLGRQVVIDGLPAFKEKCQVQVKSLALMESSSETGVLRYTPLYIKSLD